MHIDGRYIKEDKIIEIKCPSPHMREFYGTEGTDQIPQLYIAQATHMLAIEERCKAVEFFVYFHGEILRYTIRRKERLIEVYMQALLRFWGMVQEKIPPMPRNNEDVTHMYFKNNHKLIENNQGLEKFIFEHIDNKKETKRRVQKDKDDNIYIKREIGLNDGVLHSDGRKTLVPRVELKSLDQDMLEAKYPDVYKIHCNLLNEKEFKDRNPDIFEECSNIKQSSRLILPKFKAV
jgi:predicted phage-related endonuclease